MGDRVGLRPFISLARLAALAGGPARLSMALAFLVLLVACAPDTKEPVQGSANIPSRDIYRSVDGGSFIPCSVDENAHGRCGERLYRRPLDPEYETGVPGMEDGWGDCSDAETLCIGNRSYLLAVPRNGIREGLVYRTHGSQLSVVRCLPRVFQATECDTALISSKCEDRCECWNDWVHFEILFYYSREVGVTAFFLFTPSAEGLSQADPGHSWALIAESGFLKDEYRLPPFGDHKPCSNG